jgi:hypothetical protein
VVEEEEEGGGGRRVKVGAACAWGRAGAGGERAGVVGMAVAAGVVGEQAQG